MQVSVVPIRETAGKVLGKYFPNVHDTNDVYEILDFVLHSEKLEYFEVLLHDESGRKITTVTYAGEKSRKDFCRHLKFFLLKNI